MTRIYESLKEVVQETLQRSKADSILMAQARDSVASLLNDKMEELEEIVAGWIGTLKVAVQEREALVSGEVQRAEQVTESLRTKVRALEAELASAAEIVHAKEALEQSLYAKIQELENQLRNKDELVADRERQVNNLNCKLKLVKNGVKDMASFFRRAEETLAADDAQDVATGSPRGEWTMGDENPAHFQVNGMAVTSNATKDAQEVVPPWFFNRVTVALTHVLGPMAAMIVADHVAALGESMEKFPQARVPELLESLSREIRDEKSKTGFREVLDDSL